MNSKIHYLFIGIGAFFHSYSIIVYYRLPIVRPIHSKKLKVFCFYCRDICCVYTCMWMCRRTFALFPSITTSGSHHSTFNNIFPVISDAFKKIFNVISANRALGSLHLMFSDFGVFLILLFLFNLLIFVLSFKYSKKETVSESLLVKIHFALLFIDFFFLYYYIDSEISLIEPQHNKISAVLTQHLSMHIPGREPFVLILLQSADFNDPLYKNNIMDISHKLKTHLPSQRHFSVVVFYARW